MTDKYSSGAKIGLRLYIILTEIILVQKTDEQRNKPADFPAFDMFKGTQIHFQFQ